MLKRSHIRQFLALVDSGSFTHAAQRLRVTQPTLSAGIADLERTLGAPLFVRDRRGVRLTEAGGAFLPVARDLEHRFRAADGFGTARAADRPRLRMGVLRSISTAMLRRIVASLGEGFDLELQEGTDYDLRAELANGRLELALTVLRPHEDGDPAWPLLSEPYRMWAHAAHPLAHRDSIAPAELAGEVMIARRACEALTETSRFFTRNGVRPRFALKSDNDDRCMAMVAAGLGVTTAPLSLGGDGVRPLAVAGYTLARRLGLLVSGPDGQPPELGPFLAARWPGIVEAVMP